MTISPAAWLLAALLATGACLQCEVCQGPGTSCTGALQPCLEFHLACGTTLIETTVAGETSQKTIKTCMAPRQCEAGLISITHYTGVLFRMKTSCCVGDACTTPPVTLRLPDTEPNDRSCSGCVYISPDRCMNVTISCAGPETWCLYASMKAGGGATFNILHGCATASYCADPMKLFGIFPGRRVLPADEFCDDASFTSKMDVIMGFIYPTVAGFLLWILFFRLWG